MLTMVVGNVYATAQYEWVQRFNGTTTFDNDDLKKITASIDKSELTPLLPKLSNGYDTYVGKKIDKSGFEPSGGEGQKIAIARAIYHDRPIYILDEPTTGLHSYDVKKLINILQRLVEGDCSEYHSFARAKLFTP